MIKVSCFHIKTYGCQMNVYDSRVIAKILCDSGYREVSDEEKADIILVNTCSVREHAEQRALGKIGDLQRYGKDKIIGVVGCMAQNLGDKIKGADFIAGPSSYRCLPQIIVQSSEFRVQSSKRKLTSFCINTVNALHTYNSQELYSDVYPDSHNEMTAFVPVMRGCDNYCSYCIVPYVRGRKRSRPCDDILEEVRKLLAKEVKEITLLGQSINEYRFPDFRFQITDYELQSTKPLQFAELLSLVADTQVPRLKFTTSHPKYLNQKIIEVMQSKNNICKWLHLPLQSGSDRILEKMGRGYTRKDYINLIHQAREAIPDISLTTDIMVGFPGETDADFRKTIELVKEIRFDLAYMFKYSDRPGTAAEKLEPKVPEEIRQKRLTELINIQNEITYEKNEALIGTTQKVLIERKSRRGNLWYGRTDRNKAVLVKSNVEPGDFVEVKISCLQGWTPYGELKIKYQNANPNRTKCTILNPDNA